MTSQGALETSCETVGTVGDTIWILKDIILDFFIFIDFSCLCDIIVLQTILFKGVLK